METQREPTQVRLSAKSISALIGVGAGIATILVLTPKNTFHLIAELIFLMLAVLFTLHYWRLAKKASDITEQQKLRLDALEKEERFRLLFNEMLSGFALHEIICDDDDKPVDYRFLMINPAFEKMTGLQASNVVGKTFKEALTTPEQYWVDIFGKVALTGEPTVFESYFTPVHKFFAISAFCPKKGQFACIVQDVTERKKAEQALIESEKRYEQLAEQSRTFAWEVDLNGLYTYISPIAETIIGYKPEELVGKKHFYDLAPAEDKQGIIAEAEHIMADNGNFENLENRIVIKSGEIIWVNSSGIAVKDSEGNITGIRGNDRDITTRKAAEAGMNRLAACIEQADESVVITSRDGVIEYVNPAFTSVTGYTREEVIGQNPRILKSGTHDHTLYQEMWRVLGKGKVWRGRLINKKKDGTLYTQETSISPIRDEAGHVVNYAAVTHDISETLALQEQLLQSQKMESVGRLAGGIAHDFNNMLMGIMGYTELAREKLPANHPATEDLDVVLDSATRTATLTKQLLTFARKQTIKPVILDLNQTIPTALKLLRRLIGESIQLKWEPGADVWHVKMDPGQIDQILANLCVNARDALRNKNDASISIHTGNIHVTLEDCKESADAGPGDYVFCSVRDNGVGIPEAIQQQIFDPFFTTKGIGEGTGLGLSTVYGILKQNQGFITVQSKENEGTEIKLHFPRSSEATSPIQQNTNGPEISGLGHTILLVEDEESIRNIAARFLQRFQFNVLTAEDPNVAIELAQKHEGKIDIILTDMIMPGMNGKSMVEKILESRKGIKVIYMSGYTSDLLIEHQRTEDGSLFLAKPFSREQLAETIAKALQP